VNESGSAVEDVPQKAGVATFPEGLTENGSPSAGGDRILKDSEANPLSERRVCSFPTAAGGRPQKVAVATSPEGQIGNESASAGGDQRPRNFGTHSLRKPLVDGSTSAAEDVSRKA
jgi:hypothetical protein